MPQRPTPKRTIPKRTMPQDITKYLRKVVVKLHDDVLPTRDRPKPEDYYERLMTEVKKLPGEFQKLQIRPMFESADPGRINTGPACINKLIRRAQRLSPDYSPPVFFTYFVVAVPHYMGPAVVAKVFRRMEVVETAYIQPSYGIAQSPIPDPFYVQQHYLEQEPTGIDAPYAWTKKGGKGKKVKFIDIEQGWELDHADLKDAAGINNKVKLLGGFNSTANWIIQHGTAVLGIILATSNNLECIGIAREAKNPGVIAFEDPYGQNLPAAITSAACLLDPGDVLLIEVQTNDLQYDEMPVEVTQDIFQVIQLATASGVVVIEPAGNNGTDLDQSNYIPQDSGAIMVGGAYPYCNGRHIESNFGSRVNCFAWGEQVVTLWYPYNPNNPNAKNFHGTSAASAIVAGVALCVEGYFKANAKGAKKYLMPKDLRSRLSDTTPGGNTPSHNPSTDRIGVMPNLKWILQ